jgi:hypothetical protein
VSVGKEAAIPVITQKSFVVIPAPFDFNGAIAIAIGLVNNNISSLRSGLNTANANLANAQSTINGLTGLLYASLGIAIVAVIVAVMSIVVLVRRTPRGGMKGGTGESKGPEEL